MTARVDAEAHDYASVAAGRDRERAMRRRGRVAGKRLGVCRDDTCLYERGPIAWSWPAGEAGTRPCPHCTRPLSRISAHNWGGPIRPHPCYRRGPRTGAGA